MAESFIGGTLGGEDQQPDGNPAEGAADAVGIEAFAAAVAAIASRQDPQVAKDTSTFLGKQSRLLDIQAAHLSVVLHKAHEPDVLGNLADAHVLARRRPAQIHFTPTDAAAASGRDRNRAVVKRIFRIF